MCYPRINNLSNNLLESFFICASSYLTVFPNRLLIAEGPEAIGWLTSALRATLSSGGGQRHVRCHSGLDEACTSYLRWINYIPFVR
jgi:hypothetical protein